MATVRSFSILIAAASFAFAQGAGAVGLPDSPNAHTGKQLAETTDVTAALKEGTPDLWLRLRYESVADSIPGVHDINTTADDASLLSLRAVLGYSTARFYGFYGRLEFETLVRLDDDNATNLDEDFTLPPPPNANINANGHSIIADNPFLEINEAYLGWRGSAESGCAFCDGNTTVKVGRQTITYNNHRWVGNIVWRQNHQSYDAARIDNTSIPNLSASYVYLRQVNRTFGDDSIFNKFEMDNSHLINVSYKTPFGKLTGYGYLLNFDDNLRTPAGLIVEGTGTVAPPSRASFDSDTWGVRLVGKYPVRPGLKLLYEFEWANQEPTNDASATFSDNDYYNIEGGVAFKAAGAQVILKVGYEVLEGNGTNALQTPLATVHAFNGWADKFVAAPGGSATPTGGLEDLSATVVIKGLFKEVIGKSKIVFQYHDYDADTTVNGIDEYGTEWGILFAKPINKNWLALAKFASYETDVSPGNAAAFASPFDPAFAFDTQKYWLTLQYRFK